MGYGLIIYVPDAQACYCCFSRRSDLNDSIRQQRQHRINIAKNQGILEKAQSSPYHSRVNPCVDLGLEYGHSEPKDLPG